MGKILITHHGYQNTTGWARIAKDIILALDLGGFDVVPRPIILSEQKSQIPDRIIELEKKCDKDCDILLNVILPHHLEYHSGFKNISLFFGETDFIPIEWSSKLNLMDEIWVVNTDMVLACENSGITKPVKLIQPPIDISRYERTYSPLTDLKSELAGDFSFLWVGDLNRRKNLAGILKAFHTEFSTNEPVSLVIKPYKFNTSEQDLTSIVRKMSEDVCRGLKIYPELKDYKRELIISKHLTDEEMLRLHTTCDCFISCPFGEALGLSIIDSLGLGKLTIANELGGPRDYLRGLSLNHQVSEDVKNANSIVVRSNEHILEPVFGMNESFPFLFTAKERWLSPSTTAIMDRMRMAYEMDLNTKQQISNNAISTIYTMDYNNFINQVKECLKSD